MTPRPIILNQRLNWIDFGAALLILWSGMLSLLDDFLTHQYEMSPLVIGLALLLLNHGRRQPLRYFYLILLLLLLRVYLRGDERYLSAEITIFDYVLIVISFAAAYRLSRAFWKLLVPLLAIFLPLAALLSLQLRPASEALERFNAGELSVNQTAFLLGACLSLSLCFLWNALTMPRFRGLRLLLSGFWLLISLLTLELVLSTGSRYGLGLPFVCMAIGLVIADRSRLMGWMVRLSDRLQHRFRLLAGWISALISPLGLWLLGLAALVAAGVGLGAIVYSNSRNVVSDLHRLYMLQCYFTAPFSGNNRIIYGMGFTNASQTLCNDIGLIKGTTHAHNIFAQVAADNGLFALVAMIGVGIWLIKRIVRLASSSSDPIAMACVSMNLFILLVLQIEGGWGKVTFIQVMMGLAFGSLTMMQPLSAAKSSLRDGQDRETKLNDL